MTVFNEPTDPLYVPAPDWSPFVVDRRGASMRSFRNPAGICDRLRAVAFAEIQAEAAFLWAAEAMADASQELQAAWRQLAAEESRHSRWLLERMAELGGRPDERPVSDALWRGLTRAADAREFSYLMSTAERRGQQLGERLEQVLRPVDRTTADLFGRIAREEVTHVAMAAKFFPDMPDERGKGP
jgi:uncharacterized ferritin-like protein (DUF455 family)